jgi:hypothetical protein
MPTIAVVDGITIAIYYNDHNPPHLHAMQAEHEFRVDTVRAGAPSCGGSRPLATARRRKLSICAPTPCG